MCDGMGVTMVKSKKIDLDESWLKYLRPEFDQKYMSDLRNFLKEENRTQKVFPPMKKLFSALNLTVFEQVKVVILGQDPYHGMGQANGLCFSVEKGVPIPPSLQNIYKELKSDLNINTPSHGDLTSWAKQGVLLLNNVLTVREGSAGSHHDKGWEIFTDKIVELLNKEKSHIVFILWGTAAQKKGSLVDRKKHYVISTAHPSPLSAYRGFFGSKPFSKTNEYLEKKQISPIDWKID